MAARALVAEASVPVANALKLFLSSAGFDVGLARFVDDAVQQARQNEPTAVFAAAGAHFDGEALCQKLKRLKPHVPVTLMYGPEEAAPHTRAAAAGAEGFLVTPVKKPAVLSAMQSMCSRYELWLKVESLEHEVQRLRLSMAATSGTNSHDQAFFKKFLTLEVKRSKRYHYPLAFLLVGLDGLEERLIKATAADYQRSAIRAETLTLLGRLLRDIDLAVPFSDDRYLVFLPHTSRDGALTVASRLVARLSAMTSFEGGTASVGVAAHEPQATPKAEVGFGSLMREATAALRRAQQLGGGRVEATFVAMPKKNRISLA